MEDDYEDKVEKSLHERAVADAHREVEGKTPSELRSSYPDWLLGVGDDDADRVVEERLTTKLYDEYRDEAADEALLDAFDRRYRAHLRSRSNAERRRREAESRKRGEGVIKLSFRASNIRKEPSHDYRSSRPISNWETARTVREVLAELGVEASIEVSGSGKTADVSVTLPSDPDVAKRQRTRSAGRRPARIDARGSKYPEINGETTWKEFLEWSKSHKASECAEALGLSRSSYYRRLPEIRKRVAHEESRNAECHRKGEAETWHTLGNGLRKVPPEERHDAEGEAAGDGDKSE